MAGIGFALKKLSDREDIIGLFAAGFFSAFIACGPWLFTVVALSFIMVFGLQVVSAVELQEFQIILVYNFSFSYVFFGFFGLVVTRYISDRIYDKNYHAVSDVFFGSLSLGLISGLIIISCFYLFVAKMTLPEAVSAIINFIVLTSIWHASIFLTVLKEYKTVSTTFLFSLFSSVFISLYLGYEFKILGLLNGFTIGLCIILAVLYSTFLSNFQYRIESPFKFLKYFGSKWQLLLSGIFCNSGIWVDKWLMWFSPNSFVNKLNLTCDLDYSNAMFIASLTVVPSLAFFLFGTETLLDKEILNLFASIREKASYQQITFIHKKMITSIFNNLLLFIIIQGAISFLSIIASYKILEFLNIPLIQVDIFSFGVLGAFYQIFTFYLVMMLYYFDRLNSVLIIYAVFFILNASLTSLSIHMGFNYYGTGFFMASLLTFLFAGIITVIHLHKLIYHIFITNNS